MPKQPAIPEWRQMNGTQLAECVGVSTQRISNLIHLGLPRITGSKRYDVAAAFQWILARAADNDDRATSTSARTIYFEAMTEKTQLDMEKLKGNLYGRDEVDQFVMGLVGQFREACLAMPERVTRDRSIADDLEREIESALATLADAVAAWVETGRAATRTIESAAPADGQRVGKRKPANAGGKSGPGKVPKRDGAVSG